MFGINGWEAIVLLVLGVAILGPDRMPEYAAKLARLIRKARVMAEGAKGQLRDQLGPEYDDINWRQYDPRQYDPRKIVRDALMEPLDLATAGLRDDPAEAPVVDPAAASTASAPRGYDAQRPTPYDVDAT